MRPLPLKFRVLPDQRMFPEKLWPDPKGSLFPRTSFGKSFPDPDMSRLPRNTPRVSPEKDRIPPEPLGREALIRRPNIEGLVAIFT